VIFKLYRTTFRDAKENIDFPKDRKVNGCKLAASGQDKSSIF